MIEIGIQKLVGTQHVTTGIKYVWSRSLGKKTQVASPLESVNEWPKGGFVNRRQRRAQKLNASVISEADFSINAISKQPVPGDVNFFQEHGEDVQQFGLVAVVQQSAAIV